MRVPTLALTPLVALALAGSAQATVRVPALIGDNMVLQRDTKARLWGWADPGERVTAKIAGATAETVADAQGHWRLEIGPLAAGGPQTLEIRGKNALSFANVLVGDVWIASGQSNMEWPLARAADAEKEIAQARLPQVRLFTVSKATSRDPRTDVVGRWTECNPDTAPTFSAVAFFFGREIQSTLGVPIGLIHTSWGGTPAEAWTSREALAAEPALKPMVDEWDRKLADPNTEREYEKAMAEWEKNNAAIDTGNAGFPAGWAKPDFKDAEWKTMDLPRMIESAGLLIDGAIWFRRAVEIPAAWAGKDLVLTLGAVDDFDTTYFQGQKVGATGRETPGYWGQPRRYTVPAKLVRPGRAVIAVRVFDRGGDGGFAGGPADLALDLASGGDAPISLAGPWRFVVERAVGPMKPDWGSQPVRPDEQGAPTALWNAMVAPLTPASIKGAIWYQGESNAGHAYQYRTLFPAMIRDWRRAFGQGDFPFELVQLANFMARRPEPGESEWAELREAQSMTLALPATGMAVAIDIGDADTIHPLDKQDVGHRLALAALANAYGRTIEASGPVYRSHTVEGAKVRLLFDHAQRLAAKDGGALKGFAVAGSDRRFVWADARIEGESVVVSSAAVPEPAAVRYGWADNPEVNLVNGAGLPASPFRTDDWPGVTAK